MLEIKYRDHKFPCHRYDATINEVVNITRDNRPIKPSKIGKVFYIQIKNTLGKIVNINVKHISPEYAERFVQMENLSKLDISTYDQPNITEVNVAVKEKDDRAELDRVIDAALAVEEQNPHVRHRNEVLNTMGLPKNSIWISDISTLIKAQDLLDNMCYERLLYMEERAMHTMEKYNIPNSRTAIPDTMVQIAARMVLAKEEAMKYDYEKEYNLMSAEELRRTVNEFGCADFEYYLVEKWRHDLRERFFFHIAYKSNGITLRGYDSILIPICTLEDIQSAFKLLTELYGWKGER